MNENQVRKAVKKAIRNASKKLIKESLTDQGEVKDPDKKRGHEIYSGVGESQIRIGEGASGDVWAMYEALLEAMGAEQLLSELMSAMSSQEAQENFQHIADMNDIDIESGSGRAPARSRFEEDHDDGAGPHEPAASTGGPQSGKPSRVPFKKPQRGGKTGKPAPRGKERIDYARANKPAMEEKESFTPLEKEHLQENKLRLNDEIMSRWGYQNKKKEKLNG